MWPVTTQRMGTYGHLSGAWPVPGTGVQSREDPAPDPVALPVSPGAWAWKRLLQATGDMRGAQAGVFLAWLFPEADPETKIRVHGS